MALSIRLLDQAVVTESGQPAAANLTVDASDADEGELLLVLITHSATLQASPISGWTEEARAQTSGRGIACFSRLATASEGSHNFGLSDPFRSGLAVLLAVESTIGVPGVVDISTADVSGATTSLVAPSVTATDTAQMLVCHWRQVTGTAGTITAPGGMTHLYATTTPSSGFFHLARSAAETVNSGAAGTRTAASTVNATGSTLSLVLGEEASAEPVEIDATGTTTVAGTAALAATVPSDAVAVTTVDGVAELQAHQPGALELDTTGETTVTGTASLHVATHSDATGVTVVDGVASLSVTAHLDAAGTTTATGTAAFHVARHLDATGETVVAGTAILGSGASLDALGETTVTGTAAFGVVRHVDATGATVVAGTATLATTGHLNVTGETVVDGTAALHAARYLDAAGTTTVAGVASLALGEPPPLVDLHFIPLAPETAHGPAIGPGMTARIVLAPELGHGAAGEPVTVARVAGEPEPGGGASGSPETTHGRPEHDLVHGAAGAPTV